MAWNLGFIAICRFYEERFYVPWTFNELQQK
jgi:hypothetical protein